MINIFTTNQDTKKLTEIKEVEKNCWLQLTAPDDSEVQKISQLTKIPETMLKAALDEEETAHFDNEDGFNLIVIDTPVIEDGIDGLTYTTIPLAVIFNRDYVVTVCLRDITLLNDFKTSRVKNFVTFKQNTMVLQILYQNSTKFLLHLRQIDRTSHRVQSELHKSMKNKELIQLLDLEKSLVYFSTALRANDAVVIRLQKLDSIKRFSEDMELIEDVIIENKQAIEMCNIYRDILSGTMDAFASIISNNVNLVMKMLTLVTIVLAIPTLIFSFFGMNIVLPMAGGKLTWVLVIVVTVIITSIVAFVLFKKTNNIKRK